MMRKDTKIAALTIIAVAAIAVAGIGYASTIATTVNSGNTAEGSYVLLTLYNNEDTEIFTVNFPDELNYHSDRLIEDGASSITYISNDSSVSGPLRVNVQDIDDSSNLNIRLSMRLTAAITDGTTLWIQRYDNAACTAGHEIGEEYEITLGDDATYSNMTTETDYYFKITAKSDYSSSTKPTSLSFDIAFIATVSS